MPLYLSGGIVAAFRKIRRRHAYSNPPAGRNVSVRSWPFMTQIHQDGHDRGKENDEAGASMQAERR
jgi:hypothetical protein